VFLKLSIKPFKFLIIIEVSKILIIMSKKNIILAATFILVTVALNAQTKFYVHKTDGTSIGFNINEVDSISLIPPKEPVLLTTLTGEGSKITEMQFVSAQKSYLITVREDGTEFWYVLSEVQKIVFENETMTVNLKDDTNNKGFIHARFSLPPSNIENKKYTTSIFVFPNPVLTTLTVAGIEKDVKIKLFDMNGRLLQTIYSQDNTTDINVSSLQTGIYLLQVGSQTVKIEKK